MREAFKFWTIGAALFLCANLLAITSLIDGWGWWYSDNLAYRRQTDAILSGRLVLDTDPREAGWDLAWSNNGVHQVWGLGVPFWRLPFEVCARLFGCAAFPDRLEFGAAYFVVAVLVLNGVFRNDTCRDPLKYVCDYPERFVASALLLLYPPFVTLCRTRFQVYEEAAAYSYLATVALLMVTIGFVRNPTFARYCILCCLAGVLPFFRPTLLAYSATSLFLSLIWTRRSRWPLSRSLTGVGLFSLGLGLLYVSNILRFGAGFEFGHSLNVNSINPDQFAKRFDYPFRSESLLSASTELFCGLFVAENKFNGFDWYNTHFFVGQSPTFRWRELYFKTFDISTFVLVLGGWIWTIRSFRSKESESTDSCFLEGRVFCIWSLVSSVPLAFFYLRSPSICSRYFIDFAPAFVAGLVGTAFLTSRRLPSKPKWRYLAAGIFMASFGAWLTAELVTAQVNFQSIAKLTYGQVVLEMSKPFRLDQSLPNQYSIGMTLEEYGIPLNGTGWDLTTGRTKSCVTLFINDPEYLELEVASSDDGPLVDADIDNIQAKIDLASFALTSRTDTTRGSRLKFTCPSSGVKLSGIHVACIGLMRPLELTTRDSKFRLLQVRWGRTDP